MDIYYKNKYLYNIIKNTQYGGNSLENVIDNIANKYKYKNDFRKHFNESNKIKHKPIIMFSDIEHKLKYHTDNKIIKPTVHIGQRKLFLSELQFLTEYNKNNCIYTGAAPGNKTHMLSKLFPNIKFILVDPNKFDIKIENNISHRKIKHKDIIHLYHDYPTKSNIYNNNKRLTLYTNKEKIKLKKFIINSSYKIFIIEDYMNDIYAKLFKDMDLTFISDIRSNIDNDGQPTDFDIYWNYSMMYNWINILKPLCSMIKFRHIYKKNTNIDNIHSYMDEFNTSKKFGLDFIKDIKNNTLRFSKGKLYIQAWAGQVSTEMRLWIKQQDINNIIEYDNKEIEDKLFYFYTINRGYCYHYNDSVSKSLSFCNCNDCSLENVIWKNYIIKNKIRNKSVHSLVKELDIITNRPLNKVHLFNIYKNNDSKFINYVYNKLKNYIGKYKVYGKQKGNTGK